MPLEWTVNDDVDDVVVAAVEMVVVVGLGENSVGCGGCGWGWWVE